MNAFASGTRSPGWTSGLGLLLAAALSTLCAPGAFADLLEETHTVQHDVLQPAFDAAYAAPLELPAFNTQGGTRTLLGYHATYGVLADFTVNYAANASPDWVGTEFSWLAAWNAQISGAIVFPSNQGTVDFIGGVALGRPPFSDAGSETITGLGIMTDEIVTDAGLLATLTGTGMLNVESALTVSPLDIHAPVNPPVPFPLVFAPELFSLDLQRQYVDLTVTYYYDVVPEPDGLGYLCVATLALLGRRRTI